MPAILNTATRGLKKIHGVAKHINVFFLKIFAESEAQTVAPGESSTKKPLH